MFSLTETLLNVFVTVSWKKIKTILLRKSDLNRKNRDTAADRTLDAAWKNLWERYPGSAIYPVTKRNRGAQLVLNETGENFRPPLPVLQLRKGNGAFWRLQGFILVFREMGVSFSILFFPMIVAIAQPQDNPIQYAVKTVRIRKEEMKLLLPSCFLFLKQDLMGAE